MEYKLNTKTGEVTAPNGRFYCYASAWPISPAKAEGSKLVTIVPNGKDGEVFAIHPTMYLAKFESIENGQTWERTAIINR